jgi:hypothetical protein
MNTPIFTFRLPDSERATLKEVAKLYGARNPSEFVRDMLSSMCSGDLDRIQTFNMRLMHAIGGQMQLELSAAAAANQKRTKPKKKGGSRARTTRK